MSYVYLVARYLSSVCLGLAKSHVAAKLARMRWLCPCHALRLTRADVCVFPAKVIAIVIGVTWREARRKGNDQTQRDSQTDESSTWCINKQTK